MIKEGYLTRLFRSALNGIGSGAGVAWPLFGITFTLLGGSIGGLLSLALGTVSITLFITISLAIFYLSSQEMAKKEHHFQNKFKKNKQNLLTAIHHYIESIWKHFDAQQDGDGFDLFLKDRIEKDLRDTAKMIGYSALHQLLQIIHQFLIDKQQGNTKPDDEKLMDYVAQEITQAPVSTFELLIPAFLGFVGTFGSITGCSAGMAGLLTGMGVFTTLAVFPLVGWSIIAFAVLCGLVIGVGAALKAKEETQAYELNRKMKEMHQQLGEAVFVRELDSLNSTLANTTSALTVREIFPTEEANLVPNTTFFFPRLQLISHLNTLAAFFYFDKSTVDKAKKVSDRPENLAKL